MTDTHTYVDPTGAKDRLVIAEGQTMDEVRDLGRWVSMHDPVDLGVWR